MAAKRSAASDLNHENWDQDEEPEDAGTFQKASEQSLKRRIIKTARRRNPISHIRVEMDKESNVKNAFTSFTAFSKSSVPATTSFSFLPSTNPINKPDVNGTSVNSENSEKSRNEKNADSFTITNKYCFANSTTSSIPAKDTKSNDYYSKLKGLNETVSNWIKQHVDTNPLINLSPIFKDYERYFKELENEDSKNQLKPSDSGSKKNDNNISANSFVLNTGKNISDSTIEKTEQKSNTSLKNDGYNFNFGSLPVKMPVDSIPKFGFSNTSTSNTFSFGTSTSTSPSTVTPSFSFGGNVPTPNTAGFNFTNSTSFTLNNKTSSSVTNESNKQKESEEEDDEPPKAEFIPVVEKDHIFTTRCKIFVKKDGNFSDRGIGNLYLKPIENSEKKQLIVRADTNLGNLLCNFILSENIPTKRMGKKDVMLVCLPTPEFKPPPVPILLRVKSSEDADKLLEVLEKHKK